KWHSFTNSIGMNDMPPILTDSAPTFSSNSPIIAEKMMSVFGSDHLRVGSKFAIKWVTYSFIMR
ncbi:MAG: hypothetical protein CUN55_21710, partial [Phototrophicales bacterium]